MVVAADTLLLTAAGAVFADSRGGTGHEAADLELRPLTAGISTTRGAASREAWQRGATTAKALTVGGGQFCPFAGRELTGSCTGDCGWGLWPMAGTCGRSNDGEDADCSQGCVCSFAGRISAGSNGIVNCGDDLADIICFM